MLWDVYRVSCTGQIALSPSVCGVCGECCMTYVCRLSSDDIHDAAWMLGLCPPRAQPDTEPASDPAPAGTTATDEEG